MRIHGWCTKCKKIKRVRADATAFRRPGCATGICDECEEKR